MKLSSNRGGGPWPSKKHLLFLYKFTTFLPRFFKSLFSCRNFGSGKKKKKKKESKSRKSTENNECCGSTIML